MCPSTCRRTSLICVAEPRAAASASPLKRAFRNVSSPLLQTLLAGALLLWFMAPASALAQQQSGAPGRNGLSLPDAPLPHSDPGNSPQHAPLAEGSASVAGTVLDASGATVSGADVHLSHGDGSQAHTMMSESNGEFAFAKIPAGSYLVTVNAKGFAPFTSAEFAVAVLQAYEVPDISLSVASTSIEVMVRPGTHRRWANQGGREAATGRLLPKLLHQLRL